MISNDPEQSQKLGIQAIADDRRHDEAVAVVRLLT